MLHKRLDKSDFRLFSSPFLSFFLLVCSATLVALHHSLRFLSFNSFVSTLNFVPATPRTSRYPTINTQWGMVQHLGKGRDQMNLKKTLLYLMMPVLCRNQKTPAWLVEGVSLLIFIVFSSLTWHSSSKKIKDRCIYSCS